MLRRVPNAEITGKRRRGRSNLGWNDTCRRHDNCWAEGG